MNVNSLTEEEVEFETKKLQLQELLEKNTFLEKVKFFLRQYYTTVSDPKNCDFYFSTMEVFEQLQKLFPSSLYSTEDVSVWLNEGGYTFFDFGNMNFLWLFKKM